MRKMVLNATRIMNKIRIQLAVEIGEHFNDYSFGHPVDKVYS